MNRNNIIKLIAMIVLVLSFATVFILFYQSLDQPNRDRLQSALIDQKAPSFSKADLFTGASLDSNHLFEGKYTLVNVFASWCVSCKDEHGHLMKLKRDGQLQLVGLNYKDQKNDAIEFLNQLGNPYHYIIEDDGKIGFEYGVYAVPESFLIDKRGVIRYKLVGVLNDEIIQKEILPLVQ